MAVTDRTAPADPREAGEPVTEAGRRMLHDWQLRRTHPPTAARQQAYREFILAIEDEARAAALVDFTARRPGTPRDWDAERELAYRLSTTIQEAALAGITLDGRDRRDLARLLPEYEARALAARQDEPSPALREALIAGLADALTKDWPGDTRHHASVGIADYLLKRPEVCRALAANSPQTREAEGAG